MTTFKNIRDRSVSYSYENFKNTVGIDDYDDIGEALEKTINFFLNYLNIDPNNPCENLSIQESNISVENSSSFVSCFESISNNSFSLSVSSNSSDVRISWGFEGYEAALPSGYSLSRVKSFLTDSSGKLLSEDTSKIGFFNVTANTFPATFSTEVVVSSTCGDLILSSSSFLSSFSQNSSVNLNFLSSPGTSIPIVEFPPITVTSKNYNKQPIERVAADLDERIDSIPTVQMGLTDEDIQDLRDTVTAQQDLISSLERSNTDLRQSVENLSNLVRNIPGIVFPNTL